MEHTAIAMYLYSTKVIVKGNLRKLRLSTQNISGLMPKRISFSMYVNTLAEAINKIGWNRVRSTERLELPVVSAVKSGKDASTTLAIKNTIEKTLKNIRKKLL